MFQTPLFSLSPLDGRYNATVQDLKPILSEYGLIKNRLKVEIEWFIGLSTLNLSANLPLLNQEQQNQLKLLVTNFSETDALAIKEIEKTTNHDVKALEYWIKKQLIGLGLEQSGEWVHFACTSEDINNTAHGLMLQEARGVLITQARQNIAILRGQVTQYASQPMMCRTHGQTATPSTIGKEWANVVYRMEKAIHHIESVDLLGKMNGAVGNYNAHQISCPEINWPQFSEQLITKQLGLTFNPYTTQIEPHDYMAELFDAVARLNTICIDFARDVWGYISLGYFKQKLKDGEVGSSTMPHKVNPIDFENAEGNLGLANAVLKHMAEKLPISRWQRDLTDSTVLRNMGVGFGYTLLALRSLQKGLGKLELNASVIDADIDQTFELLAEAIQTVMRRYDLPQPYEQLKALTRGKGICEETLTEFINQLALPQAEKTRLLALKPRHYLGYAEQLAQAL
jgi:adenylosuccinate lyase